MCDRGDRNALEPKIRTTCSLAGAQSRSRWVPSSAPLRVSVPHPKWDCTKSSPSTVSHLVPTNPLLHLGCFRVTKSVTSRRGNKGNVQPHARTHARTDYVYLGPTKCVDHSSNLPVYFFSRLERLVRQSSLLPSLVRK